MKSNGQSCEWRVSMSKTSSIHEKGTSKLEGKVVTLFMDNNMN